MRLYVTPAGQWAGTQADAKKLGQFAEVDVPTDKPGLLAWLNNRAQKPPVAALEPEDDIADLLGAPEPEPVAPPRPPLDMTAGAIVSRIDTPRIEEIVEVIATAKGQSLRRLAGAVAVRFEELAK